MTVPTYTGAVDGGALGVTLMHEHIFVMAPELAENYPGFAGWDEDAAVESAVKRLTGLKAAGVDTLVDMTVLGLGRRPALVARVAEELPVRIIGATGVYVLSELPLYLKLRGPGCLFDEPEPLVDLMVGDLTGGMAGTGVAAGVIKCTVEREVTADVERAVRAAARAHLVTGAPLSTHSNARRRTGLELQRLLRADGVDLGRVVIGHAGDSGDLDYLLRLADAGSYLGLDRFGLDDYLPTEERVGVVVELCRRGYAERIVLSQDTCCHHDGYRAAAMAAAAPDHTVTFVTGELVPRLRRGGVSDADITTMLVHNPRRILDRR